MNQSDTSNLPWTDVWQTYGTIAGVLVSLFGFIFVYIQLRQNRASMEAQTHALVYELGHSIYQTFIEHPELRPYFYDNKPLPSQEPEKAKVLATAEMLCDFFEYIVHGHSTMSPPIRQGWSTYMKTMYKNNACLRYFIDHYKENYTAEFFQAVSTEEQI